MYEYENEFKLINKINSENIKVDNYIINLETQKNPEANSIINKIEMVSVSLKQIADVKSGLKAYEVGKGEPKQTERMKKDRVYHSNKKIDRSYYKYLKGKDVQRYNIDWSGEYLKYGINLASPRKNFDLFSDNRILVRQIPSPPPYCINAVFYKETLLNDINSMNIINIKINPLLLLAVINSKLLSYWFFYKFAKFQRKIFPQFKVNELAILNF